MSRYARKKKRNKAVRKTFIAVLIGGGVILAALVYTMSYLYEQLNEILRSYNNAQEAPLAPAAQTIAPVNEEEEDYAYTFEAPVIVSERDEYILYIGDLELPVSGATGFAPVRLEMREQPDVASAVVKTFEPGAGFLILNEQDEWWEISSGGETGFVRHELCMINLPDVIPSIRYNNTNTYNSRFASNSYAIPNISGESLYAGRTYNNRLEKEEYIVAVMYSMSKRIQVAQRRALADGNCLVIYEGFRPLSIQKKIADELRALSEMNSDVNAGLNSPPWSISWFIATGVSNHQRGCSIDVSLVQPTLDFALSGNYKYLTHAQAPYYYNMPSPIHELSREAVAFANPVTIDINTNLGGLSLSPGMRDNQAAQDLQRYCTTAGLTPLASEWWHFDDLRSRSGVPGNSVGDYILSEVYSVAPE